MPHYGILRDHKMEDVDDLRGADVYGVNDEKLGSIGDVIFDHSSGDIRYIVLKTGGLLSRKKVMVPASRVEPYGNHDDKFYAELDKERARGRTTYAEVEESEADLQRYRSWLAKITARDYFGAPGGAAAQAAVTAAAAELAAFEQAALIAEAPPDHLPPTGSGIRGAREALAIAAVTAAPVTEVHKD